MTFGKRCIRAVVLFFLFIEFAEAVECGNVPTDGCSITRDTIFAKGSYILPHGIIINAHGVSLDCNGAILNGEHNFQNGITIFRKENVTVKNCNSINYERANLFVKESDFANIENNFLGGSDWNYGIHIYHSTNSQLKNNIINNNRVGLYIESAEKEDYGHAIDETNLVNSKPVVYLFDAKNLAINRLDLGHLEINFGENISVVNNNVKGDGILLKNTVNSFISSNRISGSDIGLDLQNSNQNKIIENAISDNNLGIRIQDSNSNLIKDNSITSSSYEGFSIFFQITI